MDIDRRKIIAYVHIPKAAGSTITHLLRSRFGLNHCRAFSKSPIYDQTDLKIDKWVYPNMKSISGHQLRPHVDFGEYEEELFWFVMLREPNERFMSQYYWWRHMNNSSMEFEQWCELKGDKFSNFQVNWLAGEASAQKAIDILDKKIDCAGSQSFFDDSLKMLRLLSGNTQIPTHITKKINVAKKQRESLDIDLCIKYNQKDIELYDFFLNSKWESQKKITKNMKAEDEFKDTWVEGLSRNFNLAYHKGVYTNLKKIFR